MPKKIKPVFDAELVEFTDEHDRPLGITPLREARRQSLPHRHAAALVYDLHNKLYLRKRGPDERLYPGRYDLSASGHVRPGEARITAARRRLLQELGIDAQRLRLVLEVPASKDTGYENTTLYSTGRIAAEPKPAPKRSGEGMFVDQAELAYLAEHFRELLTPSLVYFLDAGALFPKTP